jgi:hypothetical protein
VVLAADGEEALVRWAEHEDEIALLITDVVILDSSALDRSGTRFLAKPFDVARLAKMVRELLDEA